MDLAGKAPFVSAVHAVTFGRPTTAPPVLELEAGYGDGRWGTALTEVVGQFSIEGSRTNGSANFSSLTSDANGNQDMECGSFDPRRLRAVAGRTQKL